VVRYQPDLTADSFVAAELPHEKRQVCRHRAPVIQTPIDIPEPILSHYWDHVENTVKSEGRSVSLGSFKGKALGNCRICEAKAESFFENTAVCPADRYVLRV